MTPASHAQDSGFVARVNVPFAFESGSRHYTPGIYTIGICTTRMGLEQTMLIRGTSQSGLVMTQMDQDSRRATQGKAVFQKYGNRYFLSQLWVAGKSEHVRFFTPKIQPKLQVAGNSTTPANVELALLETPR
jgi:hypothetical protein